MTPHLRAHVRAYVERDLPPPLLSLYDRHLVCCQSCRGAADQERRMLLTLRSFSGLPTGLRSSLLDLGSQPPAAPSVPPAPTNQPLPLVNSDGADGRAALPPSPLSSGSAFPQVAALPTASMSGSRTFTPVPTVSPRSPALHRSPVRAAVVASIAAGASVAAAWGLVVVPLPGSGLQPSARVPAEAVEAGPVSGATTADFAVLSTAGIVAGASTGTGDPEQRLSRRGSGSGPSRQAGQARSGSRPTTGATRLGPSVPPAGARVAPAVSQGSYWVVSTGVTAPSWATPVPAQRAPSAQSSP